MVSKLVMNTPDAAIIINGGATIANSGGTTPVEPSALNIFTKNYNAKQVKIPMPNFTPKL